MSKRSFYVRGALVVAFLGLAACAGDDDDSDANGSGATGGTEASGDDAGAAPSVIEMSASEFAYDPNEISAPADTEFEVRMENVGAVEHDFTIDGPEGGQIAAQPGETATGTFTLGAGTYDFYCTVAGHREAGMEGVLTVE